MANRSELVEAALDAHPEGVALFDGEERVILWNRAAESLTGLIGADILGRMIPPPLEGLVAKTGLEPSLPLGECPKADDGTLVHVRHKIGHDVPVVARRVILRDSLGKRIGSVVAFHAGEHLNALPHGETSEGTDIRQSQQEMDDRLQLEFEMFQREGSSLGVLWICVSQARDLRATHGARACETMLECMERTLANGLRPGEEIARWGDDEFLVLARGGDAQTLAAHARILAGLARTADFRWWGDRVSLTVSVGAATAVAGQSLKDLLDRAQAAMAASAHAGGNCVTVDGGRHVCTPS